MSVVAASDLVAIVAGDPDIRAGVKRLVIDSLAEARILLTYGTPAQKHQIIKSTVPLLLKSLADEQTDTSLDNMRLQFEEMRAAFILGALPSGMAAEVLEYAEVVEDEPTEPLVD